MGDVTSVTIKEGTRTIAASAFSGCSSLISITIPNSITSIGSNVFSLCRNLTNITIPDSATSIGGSAFSYCSSLTSITIPDSVTSIGTWAFDNCSNLTSITIPDSVTSIGSYVLSGTAYYNNESNWENGLLYINNHLINAKSDVTSVTIKEGTRTIAASAFYGCSSLISITIPNSVTNIGYYAFSYCSSLTSITIPDGITSIEEESFCYCSRLTNITIPDSVTSIEMRAFYNCDSLTDVYYLGTPEDWDGVYGNIELSGIARHYLPSIKLIQDDLDFTVIPKNISVRHDIIFATYKDGNLIDLEKKEYIGLAEEFTVKSDYDTVKVMLWKNLDGMKPMTSEKLVEK